MAMGIPTVQVAHMVAVAVAVSGTAVLVMAGMRGLVAVALVVMAVNRAAQPGMVRLVPQGYMLRLRIVHMRVEQGVRVEVAQETNRLGPWVHMAKREAQVPQVTRMVTFSKLQVGLRQRADMGVALEGRVWVAALAPVGRRVAMAAMVVVRQGWS